MVHIYMKPQNWPTKQSNLFKNEEYNSVSCYTLDGKRIFYHEIFKSPPAGLAQAIKRIAPRIDMDNISSIIENTPEMLDTRKEYLKKAVEMRHSQIIVPALIRIQNTERAERDQNANKKEQPQNHPDDEGDFLGVPCMASI